MEKQNILTSGSNIGSAHLIIAGLIIGVSMTLLLQTVIKATLMKQSFTELFILWVCIICAVICIVIGFIASALR